MAAYQYYSFDYSAAKRYQKDLIAKYQTEIAKCHDHISYWQNVIDTINRENDSKQNAADMRKTIFWILIIGSFFSCFPLFVSGPGSGPL